jgi:hypothetical protein
MITREILQVKNYNLYKSSNLFSHDFLNEMEKIFNFGIENFICSDVPKYQTESNMHKIFSINNFWIFFINTMYKELEIHFNKSYTIQASWFNLCIENSNFKYHQHENCDLTCVFYFKNCNNFGTIFKINNEEIEIETKDNSLLFFDGKIPHKIPSWKNQNRYSIAIDFKIK